MANPQELLSIPTRIDPILWVGNVLPIRLPQFFPFQKKEIEIIYRASFEEARSLLKTRKFSTILVQDIGDGEGLAFLVEARQIQPMAPRFFMAEDITEAEVREGINKAQVFRFLKSNVGEREIWEHFDKALQLHSMLLSRSVLLKESSHQNKQLEALTHSLEGMVDERTQYIEQSHHEEAEKLNRERQLIRLIKDLATQTSFEEILVILRKELRKFHKIGDPILAFQLDGGKTFFWSFQSGALTQTESTHLFDFPKVPQVPTPELVRDFANHFGRPFIKAYIVPLELRLSGHLQESHGQAILCIENSLNDKEMASFIEFINDRARPLSMVLDRVLLESQLSSFSYRWEKTFDGMRDPIAIIDMDYQVVRANRKFSEKFVQSKCYESFANRNHICEGCPVKNALAEGKPQSGQIHVDGRVYQVNSYPVILDQGGRVTNVVNQYVDITQSRELYLRMLQNEKMGAIGMLAGNIAHELNNPLTGLKSLTQVMLTEVSPASTLHSDLQEIEKATTRSQKIIKNLLDFSKGEDQPSEYISVDEVVEKTLPMLKSALRFHRLEVDLQTLGASVYVEPHLLQQVVFNVVNNACQAMKDAGRMTLRSRCEGQEVILEIEDTGPGIPEDIKQHIFKPFFTTKKEGHGTGLGLSMSRSIIEKFGGRIEFQDVAPQGTCFRIVLPLKRGPE
jgi:two-component system NtrC family sensor kinase